MQRITQEELHRHPAGPALLVRGPRDSKKKERTPNQVTEKEDWDLIEKEAEGHPVFERDRKKQRLSILEDPQSPQRAEPRTP